MKRENIYRVLDANLNRFREGVRVVEEVFRFIYEEEYYAKNLKELRHQLREIESALGHEELLAARDSARDLFSSGILSREAQREGLETLLRANLRRAQESARVLEEFLKLTDASEYAETAKSMRFSLYTLEKEWSCNGKEISTKEQ